MTTGRSIARAHPTLDGVRADDVLDVGPAARRVTHRPRRHGRRLAQGHRMIGRRPEHQRRGHERHVTNRGVTERVAPSHHRGRIDHRPPRSVDVERRARTPHHHVERTRPRFDPPGWRPSDDHRVVAPTSRQPTCHRRIDAIDQNAPHGATFRARRVSRPTADCDPPYHAQRELIRSIRRRPGPGRGLRTDVPPPRLRGSRVGHGSGPFGGGVGRERRPE